MTGSKTRSSLRWLLFLFAILIACPIRYWPLDSDADNTWVFAMNYAAAHGLAVGRDVVWTTGPMGYLVFPQDIGSNLARGLIFQSVVWLVLAAILADLFFRSGFPVRNLAFFTVLLALSAPLYWFNYTGLENLLLMGALVLFVVMRLRGGLVRYLTALALLGIMPLIKFTGGMMAGGVLAGYLTDRVIRLGRKSWPAVAVGIAVPLGAFGIACWCTLPSWSAFAGFMKASLSMAANYSIALSIPGPPVLWIAAAEIIILIGLAVLESAHTSRQLAASSVAILAIPILVALKHGFVREDMHILIFFGFASLALAIIVLGMTIAERSLRVLLLILLAVGAIDVSVYNTREDADGLEEIIGRRSAEFAWPALSFDRLRTTLRARTLNNFDAKERLNPAIRDIIGGSPVATTSIAYSHAAVDGLNLKLYPVIQKYQAYTLYLDGLNAAWIRHQGPRFLIAEWLAIDDRHPWVETPAMWAEIYRWYNTRANESWSVLLERRASPRFDHFETVRRFRMPFRGTLEMPESASPVFWTMDCRLSLTGRILQFLFRVPEIDMTIDEVSGDRESFRVVPELIASPVMGNFLPNSGDELADLLKPAATPAKLVNRITFGGPGINSYESTCDASFLRPVQ